MTTAISQAFASDQGAHTAAAALANTLVVKDRREMMVEEAPPPPYTTAELLRDANQRWGWPVEQVMEAAQVLFESGWITYPRTDSTRLSPQARDSLRHTVLATYGPNALPNDQTVGEAILQRLIGKSKSAQGKLSPTDTQDASNIEDAHEAIRPTDPARSGEGIEGKKHHRQLYKLIRQRSLASQMKAARYKLITVELENA